MVVVVNLSPNTHHSNIFRKISAQKHEIARGGAKEQKKHRLNIVEATQSQSALRANFIEEIL